MNIKRTRTPIDNSFYAKVPLINQTLITKTYTMLPDEIKTQHISRIYKKKILFKIKRLKRKYFSEILNVKSLMTGSIYGDI